MSAALKGRWPRALPMKHDYLDVELLRFFKALIQTGALHKAAGQLEMSQSAASRALQRLREVTGDPLFVKCGLGMAPTPRAVELLPEAEDLLARLEAISCPTCFAPAKSTRTFRIAVADNGFLIFLGRVLPAFLRQAPLAHIDVRQLEADLFSGLQEGRLDVAIFPAVDLPPDFHRRELLCSEYVCLMRKDHPLLTLAKGRAPTREEIDHFPRMTMRFKWGQETQTLEQRALGPMAEREPAVLTPYFIGAPMLLLESDLITVLPRPTAERFCELLPLGILPTPVQFEPFRPCLIWHHRVQADPAVRWFRSLFLSALHPQEVLEPPASLHGARP